MNPPLYILVLLVAFCGGGATSQANHTLEQLLCEKQEHGTSFQLLSNVTYVINPGNFCLIENLPANESFTIYSNGPDPAVIQCLHNTSDISSRGFGFANLVHVTIRNVVVKNCGQSLSANAAQYINNSIVFYPGSGQSAVFLFAQVGVTLENVVITDYTGYAILGVDVAPLAIQTVTVENSTFYSCQSIACTDSTYLCSGSGLFLLYTGINYRNKKDFNGSSSWVISNSSFSRNSNVVPDLDHPLYWLMTTQRLYHIPILGSAGLTLIISNTIPQTYVNVSISNCSFNENRGNVAGAVLILHLNNPSSALVTFSECIFQDNSIDLSPNGSQYIGYDVTAYYHFAIQSSQYRYNVSGMECLRIKHAWLYGNNREYNSCHVVLLQLTETYGSCNVTLEDIHCNNSACLNAMTIGGNQVGHNMNMELKDIHAVGGFSYQLGIFAFTNLGIVNVRGNSNVFDGNIGSVFSAFATDLHLNGSLVFRNNTASDGGAILLQSNSHLILKEPLHVEFENNTATYGGAIYSTESTSPFCVLQYSTNDVYTLENITKLTSKVNFTFTHNSANLAGNSIYVQPLYNCSVYFSSTVRINQQDMPKLYDSIFLFPNASLNPNGLQEVSSSPVTICFCDSITQLCNQTYQPSVETFPGKEFSLWIIPVDANYSPVYSTVFVFSSNTYGGLKPKDYVIQLFGTNCTKVNFTFYSSEPTWALLLLQPVNSFGKIQRHVRVTMRDCPPGFQCTSSGSCDCITLLSSHDIKCDINAESISRPVNSWIGVIARQNSTRVVGFASLCPTGYCKKEMRHVNLSKTASLCAGQRVGVLCGECPDHLSVIFGSTDCMTCSSIWLWTVALYGLAGVALVLFLFVLRLTVAAGTVNGLIFYANVLSTSSLIFLDHRGLRWLLVFVSLVNLDLGFPMCFYDGMDGLAKSCLQYVFPLYIWTIVILIIVLSRYSLRISKLTSNASVPVLATLIHLSYSKLLRTAIDGLTYTTVEMENDKDVSSRTVWYFDGNVNYFTGAHIGLFILAIVTLLFFVVPYTVLLSGVSVIMRYRLINRFKPLIDAYCGPYKDKWRFWFGARLWVLIALFVVYVVLKGNNDSLLLYIEALILVFFSGVQTTIQPFKNVLINILDLFFMVNGFILTSYGAYLGNSDNTLSLYIAAGILVGLAFVVFLCTITYHLSVVLPVKCHLPQRSHQENVVNCHDNNYEPIPGGVYDSDRLREPLLEDDY